MARPNISKNPLRVLAICSNYKGTSLFLPGVNVDKLNLYQFTQNANSAIALRMLENPNKDDIAHALSTFQPSVLWMCGHGVLNEANENVYIIDGGALPPRPPGRISLLPPGNILSEPEFTRLALKNARSKHVTMYVFDFCHSCTMLDLPYFYENGFFYKKLGDGHDSSERYGRFRAASTLFIVISGCSDFETTEEDARGGLLTQQLLYLMRSERALSLRILDTGLYGKARISVSRAIDPFFEFCKL